MTENTPARPAQGSALALPLLLLLVWAGATVLLSRGFGPPHTHAEEPVEIFVALQVVGGLVWLWALRALTGRGAGATLAVVVGLGLVLRLILFASTPLLENDYERYLWDGAIVAHGHDPYEHTPAAVLENPLLLGTEGAALVAEGRGVLQEVNHPDLTTIYPPVAQGAFAVAHLLAPWRPVGLRLVWLALDLAALGFLLWGTSSVTDRARHLAVYWLNPLLLKEVYNSLHMEPVLLALTTAVLVWAGRRRILSAATALGFAIGAKLWPVLWLPLLVRLRHLPRRRVLAALATTAGLALVLLLPMLHGSLRETTGLGAYARRWEMNDSAFVLIQGLLATVAREAAPFAARATVFLVLLSLLAFLVRRPVESQADLVSRALVLVAALFLLSPTQFPWYFLWCLPALALRPNTALLLLTVTLPLYYLRFRFAEWHLADVFDYGLVWLQFLPTWILLAIDLLRGRARRTAGAT